MEVQPLDAHLLTRCLRTARDDDLRTELRDLDGEAWSGLVDRAVWHGVGPLLHHRLGRWENLGIPRSQHVRLRDLYLYCLLRNEAILEQLAELLRELAGAGHPVLALKGAHLAYCVYEEPALRPVGDIDLLARPDDAPNVQRHLETLGYHHAAGTEGIDYATLHHLRRVSRVGRVDVEVHHDLAPRGAPFRLDLVGLWDRSIRTPVGDLDLPHLAPDDELLHVCTHAAYNDEFQPGLPAVCDVDAIVQKLGGELDWARMVRTANADGRAPFAYAILRLSQVLLDTPIPGDVFASLHHGRIDDRVAAAAVGYVLSMSATEGVPDTLRSVADAETPTAKLVILWRGLFPPPETLRRIYGLGPGRGLRYLYYLLRPLELVLRRGRQVLGLLIGSPRSKSVRDKERRRRMIRAWVRGKTPEA